MVRREKERSNEKLREYDDMGEDVERYPRGLWDWDWTTTAATGKVLLL